MRQIFPEPLGILGDEIDLAALAGPDGRLTPGPDVSPAVAALVGAVAALYAFPESDRPWVRANMVQSADGAAGFRGRSGGLSGAADRFVFSVLRSLADVIVVGASTARAERYGMVRQREIWPQLRTGRLPLPPIAVLTRRLDLEVGGQLLTGWPETDAQPMADARLEPKSATIVLTTADAPAARRSEAGHVADVIVAGKHEVTGRDAIDALAQRRHHRILVEGGPAILGQLTREGMLDELCLTISPFLEAGESGRIVTAGSGALDTVPRTGLTLASLVEDKGFLLARYLAALDTRRVPRPAHSGIPHRTLRARPFAHRVAAATPPARRGCSGAAVRAPRPEWPHRPRPTGAPSRRRDESCMARHAAATGGSRRRGQPGHHSEDSPTGQELSRRSRNSVPSRGRCSNRTKPGPEVLPRLAPPRPSARHQRDCREWRYHYSLLVSF